MNISPTSRKRSAQARRDYAIRRMSAAAVRMIAARTLDEKIQAGLWTIAWGIAAGAKAPSNVRLRSR
jgi:hypothetical protein